jgi:hypothetical protein
MTINYSKQVLLKRGNTAVSSTYTGPVGEITLDTDLLQLRVHDGTTQGGWVVPSGQDFINIQSNLAVISNVDVSLLANVSTLLANANSQQTQIDSLISGAIDLVTVGNSDPNTANETFWFNNDDGRLYIKQENVWTDASPTLLPTPSYITSIMEDFEGNIVPAANVTYSLGTQQAQWKDLWVSNNTIYIGNTPITVSNGSLLVGGNVVSGGGNPFNQNLNTTDAATFANVSATIGFISQINGTNPGGELVIQTDGTHNWIFDANGTTTFPGGGHISATKGGTALDAGYGYNTSLTTFYANANYAACVTGDAQTGTLNITAYNDGGPNPSRVWSFDKTGNLTLPAGGDILDSNGTSVLGGGAADTGNIVFSGASIGLDEGTADAADIYINISPNAEGWAFLQLPNDTSANITDTRLWNAAGNVEIGTGDFSNLGESYTWNFNKDGSLTFPGGNITIASNIIGSGTDAMLGSANVIIGVIAQGESGSVSLQWSDTGLDIGLGSNVAAVALNSLGGSTPGTVQIQTGVIGGSLYTWEFGANGGLTLPNGAKIGSDDAYKFATDNTVVTAVDMRDTSGRGFYTDSNGYTLRSSGEKNWGFGTTGILTLPSNSYVETTDANLKVGSQGTVTIRANAATVGGTRAWTFGTDGILAYPDGTISTGGAVYAAANASVQLISNNENTQVRVDNSNVEIYTSPNGITQYQWTFGINGATVFPGNITVPGNLSTIAGFEFYNGDPIEIVATAPINSLSFVNPYYIEIAKTGLPAGFDALLGSGTWTVTANASTFTVVSVVSNGDYWRVAVAENPNGTISTIATFNRAASGANIVIPAGGSINFSNGASILSTVGTYSNTNVASYLLQFDGDIEFTSSTAKIGNVDVVTVGDHIRSPAYQFSNGASILSNVVTKVTSSWTVTTGTDTYSFTVPESGTYQLWVDCNIPNGIIAYNATATVTNSNVPVVGAQYAWVYTGGGTPIDFVSIPNQFIGTANTIVRSNTSPSITTNRFDFGINNTSGGNVTVTYGYIKIS